MHSNISFNLSFVKKETFVIHLLQQVLEVVLMVNINLTNFLISASNVKLGLLVQEELGPVVN